MSWLVKNLILNEMIFWSLYDFQSLTFKQTTFFVLRNIKQGDKRT